MEHSAHTGLRAPRLLAPQPPSDILPMAADRSASPSIDGHDHFEGALVFFSIEASTDMATMEDGEMVVEGWRRKRM
jgi:hypothetical protein